MLQGVRHIVLAACNRWLAWRKMRAATNSHVHRGLPSGNPARRAAPAPDNPLVGNKTVFEQRSSVYILAEHVLAADQRQCVIDVGCDGALLDTLRCQIKYGLQIENRVDQSRKAFPDIRWIGCDPAAGLPSQLTVEASDTIAICANLIEQVSEPYRLLQDLSRFASSGGIVILSTTERLRAHGLNDVGPSRNDSDAREWSLTEWQELTRACGMPATFVGTVSEAKGHEGPRTIVSIHDGRVSRAMASPALIDRPLAISAVFNDRDIIESTVKAWIEHGCDVHLIDNWSTDGTYEILQSMQNLDPDRIVLERFPPEGPTSQFDLYRILERKTQIAALFPGRWIVNLDSDEIRLPLWPDMSLAQAFAVIDAAGYNAVDFSVLKFQPTVDGFSRGDDPQNFFDHFEIDASVCWSNQLKGWKQPSGPVEIAWSGGHTVRFDGLRAFPYRLLSLHYPLRSNAHAWRKINQERLPRFHEGRQKRGWHVHYDELAGQTDFIRDAADLLRFKKSHSEHDYLIELVSDWIVRRTYPNWAALHSQVAKADLTKTALTRSHRRWRKEEGGA
jgi:hypothetical protein